MLGGVPTELKPVYLLHGSDRPKITRAVRRLRERIGEDSTERLSARESSGGDAVAVCNALGLFVGEGRLVIVDEVERWKAADTKDVVAYLAAPAPATVLALVAGELKSDSALAKAVAKAALRRADAHHRVARLACRSRSPLSAAGGRRRPPPRCGAAPEDASVRGGESVCAGRQLLGGGARRRDRPPLGARRAREGWLT